MRKYTNVKISLVIIIIFVLIGTNVIAVSTSDLNKVDSDIKETQKNLENVQEEKAATTNEIARLTAQISDYEYQIENMEDEIATLSVSIDKLSNEIADKEAMYEENLERMITRLVATYKKGKTGVLDVIFSSKSITDWASNWHYLTIITENDNKFLESLDKTKNEIEGAKLKVEMDKELLETKKNNLRQTTTALQVAKEQKRVQVEKLNETEKQLQADLEQFEADKKRIEKELAEIAAREKAYAIGAPSSYGYIFPIAGLNTSAINNKSYPSYPGHTGVDINLGVVGKTVVAVKDGTVETSTALYGSIANYDINGNYIASYRSYGEYIVINHHDGTMTLYGHLKPGSRLVSQGQTVKQGQAIATVGNTGNCQPRPTSSSPLNGTHLHFEVRVNGRCVNPIPYLV